MFVDKITEAYFDPTPEFPTGNFRDLDQNEMEEVENKTKELALEILKDDNKRYDCDYNVNNILLMLPENIRNKMRVGYFSQNEDKKLKFFEIVYSHHVVLLFQYHDCLHIADPMMGVLGNNEVESATIWMKTAFKSQAIVDAIKDDGRKNSLYKLQLINPLKFMFTMKLMYPTKPIVNVQKNDFNMVLVFSDEKIELDGLNLSNLQINNLISGRGRLFCALERPLELCKNDIGKGRSVLNLSQMIEVFLKWRNLDDVILENKHRTVSKIAKKLKFRTIFEFFDINYKIKNDIFIL